MRAIGSFNNSIRNNAGDLIQTGVPSQCIFGDNFLTTDYDMPGTKSHIQIIKYGTFDSTSTIRRGFLHMNQGYIDIGDRNIAKLIARFKRILAHMTLFGRELRMLCPNFFTDTDFVNQVAS